MATAEARPTKRRAVVALWGAAAATVLFAATATVFAARHATLGRTLRLSPTGEFTGSAATSAGKRSVVRLPDSSIVTLGPASTIRYAFNGDGRAITLDGMAEFRVKHDSLRRFVVRARDAVVTDIGTEFVVRAYPTDSSVRVAVASGIVSFASSAFPDSGIVLHAQDVGGFGRSGKPAIISTDASAYRAWVDGRLAFDNQSVERVALELSRWFGVKVRVESPALARRRVSGQYTDPTLTRVLDALATSLGATYTQANGEITLRERR